uniref:Uncharacterized protein n=1 Tax=Rhizophora mucronata TaxID=61149 RepID=A0A2P2PW44_RHIMU
MVCDYLFIKRKLQCLLAEWHTVLCKFGKSTCSHYSQHSVC